MANSILVMGESGTGKSTSIRKLDPKETYIINVLDKPLPFKNFKKSYIGGIGGNYFATDNAAKILQCITAISEKRPDIKNLIIDDFQYIMANEFMRKAREKGFEKFVDIGQSAWKIIRECTAARDDLCCFILSHTETDSLGRSKCKTIGKMLDEKITLEGMFTIVLHSLIVDNSYKFLTQNDGLHIAKSPMDMFDMALIDNDLLLVKEKMAEYSGESETKQLESQQSQEDINNKKEVESKVITDYMAKLDEPATINELQNIFKHAYNYAKLTIDSDKNMLSIKNAYDSKKTVLAMHAQTGVPTQ